MELSPQTNRIVVTSGKTVSFIPALLNGPQTHSLTLPYAPSSASIHPILQDRFVTGSTTDEWVRIHDVTGEEREVLKGHHGPVHCVEYSPDGEMFASGSGELVLALSVPLIPNNTDCGRPRHRGWHYSAVADDTREDLRAVAGRPGKRRLIDFFSRHNALLYSPALLFLCR